MLVPEAFLQSRHLLEGNVVLKDDLYVYYGGSDVERDLNMLIAGLSIWSNH